MVLFNILFMFTVNERTRKTNARSKFDDKLDLYEVTIYFKYLKLYI